jgi:endoglucanase
MLGNTPRKKGKTYKSLCLSTILSASLVACSATKPTPNWPAWEGFKSAFVTVDGRVIDRSQGDLRTVSEAQAYALFFALVAQDREMFDTLLKWTENNLSAGDLGKNLPAWLWGKKDGTWGVIDGNSASDADLWISYTLLEASRIWCHTPYAEKGRALGKQILSQEVMEINGLGLSVLPGNNGFVRKDGSIKLNPSYIPLFLMARFAQEWSDDSRWAHIYLASQRLLLDSGRTGHYPDWVLYKNGQLSLPQEEQRGDYDAIRNYLWIGISDNSDPITKTLIQLLSPTTSLLQQRQYMPEWFEPMSGAVSTEPGPAGFQVATAPFLKAAGLPELAKKFNAHGLKSIEKEAWLKYGYYNGALSLFGQGYMDQLYEFNSLGKLLLRGEEAKSCD